MEAVRLSFFLTANAFSGKNVCPIFREGLCSCEDSLLTRRYEVAIYKLRRLVKALSAAGGQMIV